jgi:hypothetical protein
MQIPSSSLKLLSVQTRIRGRSYAAIVTRIGNI